MSTGTVQNPAMQNPVVLQKSFAVQIYIQLCILMNTFSLYCCIYLLEVA